MIMMNSIELFAGAGGLGVGLAQAGFVPRLLVEYNRWCCDTLRSNRAVIAGHHEHVAEVIEGDVRRVDFSPYQGRMDLVSGGPPCQPFSLGGRHRAYDDARDMFPEAVRAIRQVRPKAFVFENVKGLTRAAFQNYFQYIQLQLEHPEVVSRTDESWQEHLVRLEQHHTSNKRTGLHYRVVTKLLNAADFGVPQKRERVLFVGFRDDIDARWSFGSGDHSMEALVWDQIYGDYWERHRVARSDRVLEPRATLLAAKLSKHERPRQRPWLTVRDAIGNLPDPQTHTEGGAKILNHKFQPGAKAYPGHTGSFLDEPAKALKAGVHGVPGGENMVRKADGSVRYFTVRESARLQTFPDAYQFHGAWSEAMRQLGNAVPAKLASVVGASVAQHLADAA